MGSYTVSADEGGTSGLFTSLAAAQSSSMCTATTQYPDATSGNFVVNPGDATVFYGVFYGTGKVGSYGFGGRAGGVSGAGWFDMSPTFSNGALTNMTANYSGTGGTNGSNQRNFNIVQCNVNASANTVGLTPNILTPYSGGQANVSLGNSAICAAWFPQGNMVNITSTPANGVTAQAGQVNETATESSFGSMSGGTTYDNSMSFAGTTVNPVTSMTYTYSGTGTSSDGTSTILSTTPSLYGAFLTQNSTGEWAAVNIPMVGSSGTVSIVVNGQTIASYTYSGLPQ